jgi:four helix bundle protein
MLAMSFKKLQIWQRGFALARETYRLTVAFPKEEAYGLTSQMRRSAVSIVSNIAEGSQRGSDRDFANFILIARGSLAELETQLLLVAELGYANPANVETLLSKLDELSRMLHAFHAKLKSHSSQLKAHNSQLSSLCYSSLT